MYNTSRTMVSVLVVFLLTALLVNSQSALAEPKSTELTDAYWNGNDFLLRFADSASTSVDLVASDSSEFVIRMQGVTVSDSLLNAIFTGPGERKAAMTRIGSNAVRLTITAPTRFGYSTIWRPFSHTLWVHTFNWQGLEYAQEQYHKGLLALDQKLEEQALEYLEVADSFGERRARSVLGIYHAQHGNDSTALEYLKSPLGADDYAARALVRNRMNDTTNAAEDTGNFQRLLAENRIAAPADVSSPTANSTDSTVPAETAGTTASESDWSDITDWRSVGLIVLGLCLFVGLVIWLSSRNPRPKAPATPLVERAVRSTSSSPSETDVPVTKVVDTPAHNPVVSPAAESVGVPSTEQEHQNISENPADEEPLHAPSVMSPPLVHSHEERDQAEEAGKTEDDKDNTALENQELPEPDTEPVQDDAIAPVETREDEDIEAEPPALKEDEVSDQTEQRGSVQGDELRKKMEDARRTGESAPATKDTSISQAQGESSTISEARRLQVSRGYVELRDRISALREQLESDPDESSDKS